MFIPWAFERAKTAGSSSSPLQAPGKYEVTVTAAGYRPQTKTVLVEAKRVTIVEFKLERRQ
jgi:hypothetical protein